MGERYRSAVQNSHQRLVLLKNIFTNILEKQEFHWLSTSRPGVKLGESDTLALPNAEHIFLPSSTKSPKRFTKEKALLPLFELFDGSSHLISLLFQTTV